jgi:hypothetical protein
MQYCLYSNDSCNRANAQDSYTLPQEVKLVLKHNNYTGTILA